MSIQKDKTKRQRQLRKPTQLPSKYTEGFLHDFDKRSQTYKALQAAYDNLLDDIGGRNSLSHIQLALVERFVFLEFTLRNIEERISQNPKQCDELLGRWVQGLNSLTGLGKTIGLKRQRKQVPSIEAYAKSKGKPA